MLINSQEASDATQNTATPTQHSTEDHSQDFEEAPKKKSPRTPRTPATPLTPAINLNPPDYRYVIELLKKPETKLQVGPKNLRCAHSSEL